MPSESIDWNALLNRFWTPHHQAVRVAFSNAYVKVQSLGSGADVLITHDNPEDFIGAVLGTIAAGGNVFLGSSKWSDSEWIEFSQIVKPHAILGEAHACVKLSQNGSTPERSGFWMVSTGGSGGKLKFTIHTTESLKAACDGLAQRRAVPLHSASALPIHHVSGIMPALRALFSEGTWIPLDGKSLDSGQFTNIKDIHAFTLSAVPTQLARWIKFDEGLRWLKSFRFIFIGAGACPKPLVQKALEKGLPIILVYGMTETAAMILLQDPISGKTTALPHVKLRFSEPNAQGWQTLSIAAPSLFCGYYPDVPRLHESFSPSDVFRLDEDGNILEIRRSDRVIITGGKKVDPTEVEYALLKSGLVHAAHVFGEPDLEWGQSVVALCVPAEAHLNEDDLKTYLKSKLASHKMPKRYELISELPHDEKGKLKRL
jgi:o-succinylbenzoate---CoA ligase